MAGGFRKCGLFLPRLRLLFSFKTSPSGSHILPGSQEKGTDPDCDALRVGKPNPVLCDDLEGWVKEGGREAQEGGDMGTCVCIWLIHFVVQQKLTQYSEAIILQ